MQNLQLSSFKTEEEIKKLESKEGGIGRKKDEVMIAKLIDCDCKVDLVSGGLA